MANYVVAIAVSRLEGDVLPGVMEEMGGAFGRTIKLGRTGVQRALVDRAAQTAMCEGEVIEVCFFRFSACVKSILETDYNNAFCSVYGRLCAMLLASMLTAIAQLSRFVFWRFRLPR